MPLKFNSPQEAVEHSIIKKYRRVIWCPFIQALKDFQLVQDGDKVAVCISGGKDSMLLAKCIQELKRHSGTDFDVVYLVMDPGYNSENRALIEYNARLLGLPITVFETDVFHSVENVEKGGCYLCARMRRGCLYKKAQEMGCNKIALGHHYDDVVETVLLSMFYGGEVKTMPPKLHSAHYDGMELIRPLYYVRESDVMAWRDYHNLRFLHCACKYDTEEGANSKRREIKAWLERLRAADPVIEKNIFKSMENVNIDTVLGYKTHGEKHSFLEHY
jgi:tRNA(Ile)-lysidine synthase TilS/MesJ